MQFVQLVATLLFAVGSALASDASLNCEANRQSLLTNFLHSEKSRSFAELIATAKWFKPGQLHTWRFLPTYFEKGTGTFSHFFLLNGNFTANEAYEACQRFDGAYLASFHSTERWEFVNRFIVHGNYWFGLSRWTKCPHWFWPNGNVFNADAYKSFWGANEPTSYDSGFNCARTVSPASLNCSLATGCTAKESAWWKTESCSGTTGYSALCETTYPRALYGYLPGKFDWKGANTACKTQFGPGAGLAMPRSEASLNALFYGSNLYHKNWNCWIGLERLYENEIWKHRFFDGNWATSWTYLPRLYGTNYTSWNNEERCVSLYDSTYAKGLGFNEQGYFNYNKCNADFKLDCAICELYWPL